MNYLDTLTWNNIVPFLSSGFICNADGSFFVSMHPPNRNNPRLCAKEIFQFKSNFSPSLLRSVQRENPKTRTVARMKEVAVCSHDDMVKLLIRHQGFTGGFDDIIEQCLYLFTFLYPVRMEDREQPEKLSSFITKQEIVEADWLLECAQEEEPDLFDNDNTLPDNQDEMWDNKVLGNFEICRNKTLNWYTVFRPTGETVFSNFAFLLEAQLHTESLVEYINHHPYQHLLEHPSSIMDFFIMDILPPEEYPGDIYQENEDDAMSQFLKD